MPAADQAAEANAQVHAASWGAPAGSTAHRRNGLRRNSSTAQPIRARLICGSDRTRYLASAAPGIPLRACVRFPAASVVRPPTITSVRLTIDAIEVKIEVGKREAGALKSRRIGHGQRALALVDYVGKGCDVVHREHASNRDVERSRHALDIDAGGERPQRLLGCGRKCRQRIGHDQRAECFAMPHGERHRYESPNRCLARRVGAESARCDSSATRASWLWFPGGVTPPTA